MTTKSEKTKEQKEAERVHERALQLARKESVEPVSVEEMVRRVPEWAPEEFDLGEFLSELRGGKN